MPLSEVTVDYVADLLKDANVAGPKACLLIGAGASKTAGIGLASDFVTRIKARYPQVYADACKKFTGSGEPGYAQCMAALPPARQVQLVREDIDKAKINWAHIGIARLEQAEIVDSILTANFDPLASRACALFHRFPAIYDLAGLRDESEDHISFDRSYVKGSAIFHLHGQHTGFMLLNTEEKLLAQARRIRPVLESVMKGKPVIVAGYSGGNDPLIERIAALAPFNHGLFWVCHSAADPAANVCEQLLCLENCHVIRNRPADRFFTELANGLQLEAPKFLFSPFEHMSGILETIECYSEDRGSPQDSLLAQAKKHLQTAAAEARERGAAATDIAELASAGRYEEVLERASSNLGELSEEDRDQAAWAAVTIADSLGDQASAKSGPEADELFAQAYAKYAAALAIKPDMHEALNNWGLALLNQAETKEGEEAEVLLAAAGEKYAAALEIKSTMHEALNNWGIVLGNQAKAREGEEADSLFAAAGEKYAAGLAIKPDDHDKLLNWGGLLADQALTKSGEEAQALFTAAAEKYAAALAIKPDKHEALNDWGLTLANQAQTKVGEEADALLAAAGEKYAAGLAIKPDDHVKLLNWGALLADQAQRKGGGDEADALFAAAAQKYAAALAIKPDLHDVLNNWGLALLHQARTKKGGEAEALFAQAAEKFAAALAIKPDKHESLNNWGLSLLDQARRMAGAPAESLFAQAEAKMDLAESALAGSASYNLACLHALRGDAEAASRFLRRSKELGVDFPGCEHIGRDSDFDAIRGGELFQQALADIGCGPDSSPGHASPAAGGPPGSQGKRS